jgi:hypothetical protein
LEMKLARQAAAMEELATIIWIDEMLPLLFAYVMALNLKRLVRSGCHPSDSESRC